MGCGRRSTDFFLFRDWAELAIRDSAQIHAESRRQMSPRNIAAELLAGRAMQDKTPSE